MKIFLHIILFFLTSSAVSLAKEPINLICKNNELLSSVSKSEFPDLFLEIYKDKKYVGPFKAFKGIEKNNFGTIDFKFGRIETSLPIIKINDQVIETFYISEPNDEQSIYFKSMKISRISGLLSQTTYKANFEEFILSFNKFTIENQNINLENIKTDFLNKNDNFQEFQYNEVSCKKIKRKF